MGSEQQHHQRHRLFSRVRARNSDGSNPRLTGVGYSAGTTEEHVDTRVSDSVDEKVIAKRAGAISSAIKAAIEHGDIVIEADSILVNTEYLHPNLVSACRFRVGDYNEEIRPPEQDGIFVSEFGARVRRKAMACLRKTHTVEDPDSATKIIDAVLFVTRMIIAERLREGHVEEMRRSIERKLETREKTVYDHANGYSPVTPPVKQKYLRMKRAKAETGAGDASEGEAA